MVILVTGAMGQLGREFVKHLSPSHTVVGFGKQELDITNKAEVEIKFSTIKPDLIIHTAAYTAVDECEKNRNKAFEVNGLGTGYVAQAANRLGAKLIYFSSDYVFDGGKTQPYLETDPPNPQSTYGLSKQLGEQLTLLSDDYVIIRTSWLYGHGGKNFVNTMLNLANKNEVVKVVADQQGTPTYVTDLVKTTCNLFDKPKGIYHITNSGSCSWYDFAKAIFEEVGYETHNVYKTTTEEFGSLAPRPRYSVLDHQQLIKNHVIPPQPWREALKEYLRKEQTQ